MTQAEKDKIIAESQEKLAEAEKIEVDDPKQWEPDIGDDYFVIYGNGDIDTSNWENDKWDRWRYLIGNCFKTEEEAEEYKKQIEYTAQYKNYIEEHSDPIDWEDGEQEKWFAYYAWSTERLDCDYRLSYKFPGVIYASSKEIIWSAIEEIGEDNFKKYVLRAK